MRKNRFSIMWMACLLAPGMLMCACSKKVEDRVPQESVPPGSPMASTISFEYAVFYLPVPQRDPLEALQARMEKDHSDFEHVAELPDDPRGVCVSARLEEDVQAEYAPPDMGALQYFGLGLSREQAEALQGCEQALVLDFAHPADMRWKALRSANELALAAAREGGGLIWDEETRQVFSPEEWEKQRIASWESTIPHVWKHFTIHAYNSGESARAITLGMEKFGLPDVVVDEFPWSRNTGVGNLINLFCQAMAEGGEVGTAGDYDLDIRSLSITETPEPDSEGFDADNAPVALLSLKEGVREEGDPENRLIEIEFDRYPGGDLHARQEALLASFFGSEDSVSRIRRHTDDLQRASERAKAKLAALREAFNAGLAPGEFISVKAPFATPDGGREWMWVNVSSWKGNRIEGLLLNEPLNIPDLHGGQIVKVSQKDVFDYIHHYADGRQEGDETGKLIRAKERGN